MQPNPSMARLCYSFLSVVITHNTSINCLSLEWKHIIWMIMFIFVLEMKQRRKKFWIGINIHVTWLWQGYLRKVRQRSSKGCATGRNAKFTFASLSINIDVSSFIDPKLALNRREIALLPSTNAHPCIIWEIHFPRSGHSPAGVIKAPQLRHEMLSILVLFQTWEFFWETFLRVMTFHLMHWLWSRDYNYLTTLSGNWSFVFGHPK